MCKILIIVGIYMKPFNQNYFYLFAKFLIDIERQTNEIRNVNNQRPGKILTLSIKLQNILYYLSINII